MKTGILAGGAIVALIMIWRYATKKVKRRTHPRGGMVVVAAPSGGMAHNQGSRGAALGTVVLVNIVSALGSAIYIYVYGSGSTDGWWLFGSLVGLYVSPFIAFKVLEASEPAETYTLLGTLAALCILAWLLAAPWFVMEIAQDIRGG